MGGRAQALARRAQAMGGDLTKRDRAPGRRVWQVSVACPCRAHADGQHFLRASNLARVEAWLDAQEPHVAYEKAQAGA